MEAKTIHEIVTELIGSIQPAGDSSIDEGRFANLRNMTELVEELLKEISDIADCKDNHEHSMKQAGELAHHFLNDVATEYIPSPPSVPITEEEIEKNFYLIEDVREMKEEEFNIMQKLRREGAKWAIQHQGKESEGIGRGSITVTFPRRR